MGNQKILSDYPKGWTDYPIVELGDEPYEEAPIRDVEVLEYDGNKYFTVLVGGIRLDIKRCYVYKSPGRFGEVHLWDHHV